MRFLPATGRLGTRRAAEFALKEGNSRNTTTAGPAPQQLSFRPCFCIGTNVWTGTNLHVGGLRAGTLL